MIPDPHKHKLQWSAKYPDSELGCPPINAYRNRWVRFHTLPESKRYPENEAEYKTILERHNTLLKELDPGSSLTVITTEWTNEPEPDSPQRWPLRSELEPESVHWNTMDEDPDETRPDFKTYRQTYINIRSWKPGGLDDLLRAVADDELAGVIFAPEDFSWLYCPYDGGMDIIADSSEKRDDLKKRFSEWLSSHPEGY